MPKPNPLSQALNRPTAPPPAVAAPVSEAAAAPETRKGPARSRTGRVLVAGHFSPQVQIALKVIAAEERTTVQALLAEGINTILARRGKPEIAEFSAA